MSLTLHVRKFFNPVLLKDLASLIFRKKNHLGEEFYFKLINFHRLAAFVTLAFESKNLFDKKDGDAAQSTT